jgi:hypothetical protein
MTEPRRTKAPARRGRRRRPQSARNFWGNADAFDAAPELIRPSDEPTAMLQSLGPPQLPGGDTIAVHYFVAVYQRASAMAIALAAASGLLDDEADDERGDDRDDDDRGFETDDD